MDLGLAGKTALVTGGYRGTGAGIAQVLATEGAHVIVHGFEAGQADGVVTQITESGGSAAATAANISTDAGAAQLEEIARQVDVLVNNYGTPGGSNWESMDHWAQEWNANVLTGIRVAQLCVPGMRDRGWGRLIFLGTVGSRIPGERNPGYYGAKAGTHAMVRSLAMSLKGSGITANLVSPGMIATDEVRAMFIGRAKRNGVAGEWPAVEAWVMDNAMGNLTGHIPEPEDIGHLVAFVASKHSWHINGADLAIDGGAVDAR
jgi:3-oxoacyl-[acyl-carrier protein] reductase